MSRIYGTPGIFGNTIYRNESGEIVGESRPGIIPGTSHYYNADGQHVGYGTESIFGGENLHSDTDGFMGYTQPSLFGESIHNADGEYVGHGYDGLFGPNIDFTDPFDF